MKHNEVHVVVDLVDDDLVLISSTCLLLLLSTCFVFSLSCSTLLFDNIIYGEELSSCCVVVVASQGALMDVLLSYPRGNCIMTIYVPDTKFSNVNIPCGDVEVLSIIMELDLPPHVNSHTFTFDML